MRSRTLSLALLIDREDDRVGGRIKIKTDHIPAFLGELRIIRQLERLDAVRRQLMRLKDALLQFPGGADFCSTGFYGWRTSRGSTQ